MAVAAFVVEAKQNSLKRQRTAEKSRLRNKAKKSEISTRMKKVHTPVLTPGCSLAAARPPDPQETPAWGGR